MFSGIVEAAGAVRRIDETGGGRRLEVAAPFARELALGQSVAVDGACLTVSALGDGTFFADAVSSTLARTLAGRYEVGARVNLERALRVGDRMDGHWVQGHVDGLGTLAELRRSGRAVFMDFRLPEDVFALTALHGSIALNGVSLTVNRLGADRRCEVAIVPLTWDRTNLSRARPGDAVNVEGDLIGRYVERALEARRAPAR